MISGGAWRAATSARLGCSCRIVAKRSILTVSVETMDLAEACDRVSSTRARGRWTRSRRTTPTRSSISSIHAQLHREGAMTIHDHNTQFEDVTVQPGAVDAVSDGCPRWRRQRCRRRCGVASARDATGARSIASKYALLVVWAAMALFFYIALPSTFGRVATLQSIFGSQEVLVFLGSPPSPPSRSASSTCRSPRSWVLPPPPCRLLVTLHHWNVALACVVAIVACLACGALNAFFVVKVGVSSLVVTLGPERCLSEWPSSSPPRASLDFECGLLQTLALSILGLPISFYYGLVLVAAFAYMSSWTPLGRHMLFVGANREVARLAGIRVNRVRTGSYLVASVIAGIGGILLVSSTAGSTPAGRRATCCPPRRSLPRHRSRPTRPVQPIGTLIASTSSRPASSDLELFGYSGWSRTSSTARASW